MPESRSTNSVASRSLVVGACRTAGALFACGLLVGGVVVAGSTAPQAAAMPRLTTVWPDPACGSPRDTGIDLWEDVKDATPSLPGHNKKVVFPGGLREHGYAIHDGTSATKTTFNYLLISTVRLRGIECPSLLNSGAPEYFRDAYDNIDILPKGTDWALGIDSADNRSRDQFHIHISRLDTSARTDIDNAAKWIPTTESAWSRAIITVNKKRFCAWNAPNVDGNLFVLLYDHLVKPWQSGPTPQFNMGHETLLVTGNKKGSGFIVLGSAEVSPFAKPGANNIEFLLDTG
jgi:CDP-diacylglycerol pyrophosphatase